MLGNDDYTPAEQTIEAVNQYLNALHLAEKNLGTPTPVWSSVMENLAESLRILHRHQSSNQLLMEWYQELAHRPGEDIHQFVNALWTFVLNSHEKIKPLADHHFRCCIWEFILGTVLLIAPPLVFILMLPLLSNPVILAPVFLLTCVMLPLIGHFLLIRPAMKDLQASKTLNQTMSASKSIEGLSPNQFFNASCFDALRADITVKYQSM